MTKRYVLVGASSRCIGMFAIPIKERFSDVASIVGIFDINRTRATYVAGLINPEISVYTDFDQMMRDIQPDAAIITTVDRYHHEYIVKTLDYGIDAITEKPMTTDEVKLKEILDAEKRSGNKVRVTFNYRYGPFVTKIKELIQGGAIGQVLNVDFEYLLDTSHGADYFRRWHRKRENSGSLLVHKSTHHFDLVNWWIMESPEEVYANGTRRFYGPTRDERGERCSTCKYAESCKFFVDYVKNDSFNNLYFKAEHEDGYFRDRCVFSDEIDIEDTMSVTVKYSGGALLTYSLITYSPYEGWKVSISGTKGRLEAAEYHSGRQMVVQNQTLDLFNINGEKITYLLPKVDGDHGGGDERLQNMLFRDNIPDPMGHTAGSGDGARSILIGICAGKSIREKKPFFVKDFYQG
jgi:predicted dehydrogenase